MSQTDMDKWVSIVVAALLYNPIEDVQNLNTTNNEDTTVSYRVIILRPDKTPSRVTLTPRFKTHDEASMYGFFRADDYDFELEECTVAANCVLRDNKLVYVA